MQAVSFESTGSERQGETILVVDDEDGPRLALRYVLEPRFRVLTASSGQQALEVVAQQDVDLVTLDLTMPGLGGVATLSRIRDLDEQLPVVIITGCGSYESARESVRLRAFDYLTKPFDGAEVLKVVDRACRSAVPRAQPRADAALQDLADELYERILALTAAPAFRSTENHRLRSEDLRLLARSLWTHLEKSGPVYLSGLLRQLAELPAPLSSAFGQDEWSIFHEVWAIARNLHARIGSQEAA